MKPADGRTCLPRRGDPMMIRRPITRTLLLSAVLQFLLLSGILVPAFGDMSPLQYWMVGARFAENKLYIDAVENYTMAIRTNNGEMDIEDVARVFRDRGIAYRRLNQPGNALSDFDNAIDLDDRNPDLFAERGRFYLERGNYGKARADFDEALKLAPNNADAREGRGRAALKEGDAGQAIADYEKVLSLEPRNREARYFLGIAYKRAGNDDRAHEAFDRLIKDAGTHPAAAYHKAGLFARQKKIDSACIWLQIAAQDGFRDWSALKNDGDFDSIRKNPCYLRIVAGK